MVMTLVISESSAEFLHYHCDIAVIKLKKTVLHIPTFD